MKHMKGKALATLVSCVCLLSSCVTTRYWVGEVKYYLPTGEVQTYPAIHSEWQDGRGMEERTEVYGLGDDTLRIISLVPHIFYGVETTLSEVEKEKNLNKRDIGTGPAEIEVDGIKYTIPRADYDSIKNHSHTEKQFKENLKKYVEKKREKGKL